MIGLLKKTWAIIRRPSAHLSLGFLTVGGFLMGITFWDVVFRISLGWRLLGGLIAGSARIAILKDGFE